MLCPFAAVLSYKLMMFAIAHIVSAGICFYTAIITCAM